MEMLEGNEVEAIILNMLEARSPEGIDEDELEAMVNWAATARFHNMILDMIINRQINVSYFDLVEDEPAFIAITKE